MMRISCFIVKLFSLILVVVMFGGCSSCLDWAKACPTTAEKNRELYDQMGKIRQQEFNKSNVQQVEGNLQQSGKVSSE